MAIRTELTSVGSLYRKAEREAYRALHARSKSHKADHFLNFCITLHSLRDYYLELSGVSHGPNRAQLHAHWDSDSLIVAVKEIANLTKHFQLRERRSKRPIAPRTRRLTHRPSTAGHVYVAPDGRIEVISRPARDITITTSDGQKHDLWTFQVDTLEYWRDFLRTRGQRVRREPLKRLMDLAPGA